MQRVLRLKLELLAWRGSRRPERGAEQWKTSAAVAHGNVLVHTHAACAVDWWEFAVSVCV